MLAMADVLAEVRASSPLPAALLAAEAAVGAIDQTDDRDDTSAPVSAAAAPAVASASSSSSSHTTHATRAGMMQRRPVIENDIFYQKIQAMRSDMFEDSDDDVPNNPAPPAAEETNSSTNAKTDGKPAKKQKPKKPSKPKPLDEKAMERERQKQKQESARLLRDQGESIRLEPKVPVKNSRENLLKSLLAATGPRPAVKKAVTLPAPFAGSASGSITPSTSSLSRATSSLSNSSISATTTTTTTSSSNINAAGAATTTATPPPVINVLSARKPAAEGGKLPAYTAARSPSFSPDGKTLVWLQNAVDKPHAAASAIVRCPWPAVNGSSADASAPTTPAAAASVVLGVPEESNELCCTMQRLPPSCWLDNSRLVINATCRSRVGLAVLDLSAAGPSRLQPLVDEPDTNYTLLAASGRQILATAASPSRSPSLHVFTVAETSASSESESTVARREELIAGVAFGVSARVLDFQTDGCDWDAILIEGSSGSEAAKKTERPLVVVPHGGPHSAFTFMYYPMYAAMASQGYVLLLVNFRGSLGYGQRNLMSLIGNIGRHDVEDCNRATSYVLEQGLASPDKVAVFGGSHGGFLTAHLSGQFPDRYKVAMLRNPVIDLPAMAGTSDIPDWCYAEAGEDYTPDIQATMSMETLQKLRTMSPIIHAPKVRAATLLLLGGKDLRVPPSQGMIWYNALRSRGLPLELLTYPEDSHPLSGTETEADVFVQAMLWLRKYL
eukprot:m.164143 g.164143  ORF g.164143 m.164143 type:complete len:727 (-) comp17128_c3_seq1:260-2440(-)